MMHFIYRNVTIRWSTVNGWKQHFTIIPVCVAQTAFSFVATGKFWNLFFLCIVHGKFSLLTRRCCFLTPGAIFKC